MDRTFSVQGRMERNERQSLLPYVAALTMIVAALVVRATAEPAPVSSDAIERYLETELEVRVGSILEWERRRQHDVERIAEDPGLIDVIEAPRATIDGRLARLCAELDGCALARADGLLLGAHGAQDAPPDLVRRALAGHTVHSRVLATEAGVDPATGRARYALYYATPVVRERRIDAVLIGRMHPDRELGPILGRAPPGRSGETYAVDPRGFMVTRSRFEAQARRSSSALSVIGTPASWLREKERTLAGTRSGSDVDGYLDYRGVRVVGAWRWLDELGAGVITEMDADEASRLGLLLR